MGYLIEIYQQSWGERPRTTSEPAQRLCGNAGKAWFASSYQTPKIVQVSLQIALTQLPTSIDPTF